MGYQNGNDNTGIDSNKNNNAASTQRISNVSKLSKDTSTAQYERHGKSTQVDTRGKASESYECSHRPSDNQKEVEAAIGRTSGINSVLKGIGEGTYGRLTGSGTPIGTGE